MKEKNIAIVHEWLVNYAGSEKCVESFTNIWKDADVYSLVDFLDDDLRNIILKGSTLILLLSSIYLMLKHNIESIFHYSQWQLNHLILKIMI